MIASDATNTRAPAPAGERVLVVEDDYFIAQDLCRALRGLGATIVGPAPSIAAARTLLEQTVPDRVLLDINLDGEYAFELATQLQQRGMRLMFITGYDFAFIPPALQRVARLQKPVDANVLAQGLAC
ncbi:MAG TPA: response regulator [Steroidobacteraceae bacterium]|nr:response regulator [Steroidobacteraceae bacterium]